MKTAWLYRPLLNTQEVYQWASEIGIKKMMPANELHMTLATCRSPVDWNLITLQTNQLEIPAGYKTVQIFGYIAKAISFGHPAVKERHEELAALLPTMDHPTVLRPHVTLMRGGKMPREGYPGRLLFGPEVLEEFNERAVKEIKHVLVRDMIEGPEDEDQ